MNFVNVLSSTRDKIKRTIIKILVYGKNDVQTANQVSSFGLDSNPLKDMVAVYGKTEHSGDTVVLGYLNKNQITEAGESRLYSEMPDGSLSIDLILKKDGTAEFGGNDNFMVRYNELESAFNQLKNDFNSLVNSYNSHTHITTATISATAVPGTIAPTVSSGSPSNADISPAKISNIKTS